MFAPLAGIDEDPVCGSAHCMLGPYWTMKHGLVGVEVKAKQVSPRGGDLRLIWEAEKGIVRLRGESKLILKGEIFS
jgi:predicted PhzF superfamily epimerase YddE/YHI9